MRKTISIFSVVVFLVSACLSFGQGASGTVDLRSLKKEERGVGGFDAMVVRWFGTMKEFVTGGRKGENTVVLDKKTTGRRTPGDQYIPEGFSKVELIRSFGYSPMPRDPFIGANSPTTLLDARRGETDLSRETLLTFATQRLKGGIEKKYSIIGVSVQDNKKSCAALAQIRRATDGMAGGAGPGGGVGDLGKIGEANMSSKAKKTGAKKPSSGRGREGAGVTKTITMMTGVSLKLSEEELASLASLYKLVEKTAPVEIKRDALTGETLFPIKTISEKGVLVLIPGLDEPLLLPLKQLEMAEENAE